jgi:hypothetical protein
MANTLHQRAIVTDGGKLPAFLVFAVGLQWVAVLFLATNAVIPPLQGMPLFQAGVTLSFGAVLQFVRRISSLLGDKPGEDWDPSRGQLEPA